MKFIIIGAGAIGMLQARELASAGHQVQLIDKGLCGNESSWAGGGIVSPLYPWRYSEPVTALASWSQGFYGNLVESLECESGVDPELSHHGLLVISVDDRERAMSWAEDHQLWLEQVDEEKIYKLEPRLRAGCQSAMWMSRVASVRNPRLVKALRGSLNRNGNVEIIEGTPVSGILTENGRAIGVELEHKSLRADGVILSGGAWSAELLSPLGLQLPVKPIKGQMILFETSGELVKRIVLRDGKYVIPRRDGSVLAGSTLEDSGFDKSISENALEQLKEAAVDMFPDLATCPLRHHWAGLRPGSPDGIPFIGELDSVKGLYLNTGHFRNGLVLAPASTRLLAAQILGEQPPVDPAPYLPEPRLIGATATPDPAS